MALNYPIIKEKEMELEKLLLVVVDSGQMKEAVKLFADARAPIINKFTKKNDCEKIISSANSTFVIFPYVQSDWANDYLLFLASLVRSTSYGISGINAIPVVISEGLPFGCSLEDLFIVFLSGNLEDVNVDFMFVVPPDNKLELVYDRIRRIESSNADEKAFLTAACFLYPNLVEGDAEWKFYELKKYIKELVQFDDDNHSSNGIVKAFVQELYSWQKNVGFPRLYELPNLGMEATDSMEDAVFFDDYSFFIKEIFFKKIITSLLATFSIDVIKRALACDGLIHTENTSTYVVKMPFYNLAGQYKRERMLRFDRRRFEYLGEFDFIEFCKYSEEGEGEYAINRVG